MYEEVKLQRETIKDLEKQILVYKTNRADSKRDRSVSVQKMERSARSFEISFRKKNWTLERH